MSRAKKPQADVAQLAEHLICNQAVASSTLAVSSGGGLESTVSSGRSAWGEIGGVPKRPTGADCKSAGFTPTKVRILPPPWCGSLTSVASCHLERVENVPRE